LKSPTLKTTKNKKSKLRYWNGNYDSNDQRPA
jgi:hypothetical protein